MKDSEPPSLSRRTFLELLAGGGVCLGLDPAGALFAPPRKEEPPLVTFGAVADAQFADAPHKGTRFYRRSPAKLAAAVKELNRRKPDFSVHLGDFIDRDFKSFDTMVPIWSKLSAPGYHVLGNHDFKVRDRDKALVLRRLGLDRLGSGEGWYSFSLQGWRFLFLDGNALSIQRFPSGSPGRREAEARLADLKARKTLNAMPWNGALGEKQWKWLGKELDRAARRKERVLLFSHYPVYPANVHNQWDAREIVKLLDGRQNVTAWIDGHNHAGNYGFHGGVHYLNLPGMVETPKSSAFALVEVRPAYLKIVGYGRTPSRVLPEGERERSKKPLREKTRR